MPELGLNISQSLERERAAEYRRAREAGEIQPEEQPEEEPRLNPQWPYVVISFDPEMLS